MIKLPSLDEGSFSDFSSQARALIPSLTPAWTDHNPSDPGIMLVELFAWLAEIVSFRIDQVPERSYRTFLRLLRGGDITAEDGSVLALEDAIRATLRELRDRHRAVTSEDFEYLALQRWPDLEAARSLGQLGSVRRAHCIAEHTPETLPSRWQTPAPTRGQGHFTLVVVPDSLLADRGDLEAFHPSRRHALELDGSQAHVNCGPLEGLELTGALTLSAWIFPRNRDRGRQGILSKHANGEFEFLLEPNGALTFRQADGSEGGTASANIPVGRWSHVAAVRAADGKSVQLYRDGKAAGSAKLEKEPIATNTSVCIGKLSAGGGFFDGFMRDVCVWGVARSEVELQGDLRRAAPAARPPGQGSEPTVHLACWRLDASTEQPDGTFGLTPDAQTPESAPQRPRDGALVSAQWCDMVRPIEAGPQLLEGLFEFLDEWRLLTTAVDVIPYRPLGVRISGSVYLRSDGVPAAVRAAARTQLESLLDPLRGWDGRGWPFGRAVYNSDLSAALDGLPGVDFVATLSIQGDRDAEAGRPPAPVDGGDEPKPIGVALQPDELPWLRDTNFDIFQRVGTRWQKT